MVNYNRIRKMNTGGVTSPVFTNVYNQANPQATPRLGTNQLEGLPLDFSTKPTFKSEWKDSWKNTKQTIKDSFSKENLSFLKDPKTIKGAFDALGNGLQQLTRTNQSANVSKGMDIANGVVNVLGTVNPILGAVGKTAMSVINAVDKIGARKTDKFSADQSVLAQVGGSYGGTSDDILNASSKANTEYGLLSNRARRKDNKLIAEAKQQQTVMKGIAQDAEDMRNSISDMSYFRYMMNSNGGYDPLNTIRVAKSGMKLKDKIELVKSRTLHPIKEEQWEPEIVDIIQEFKDGGVIESSEWEPEITLEIPEESVVLKEGGTITKELDTPEIEETTQKNVIPEGALHKNKHHIENTEGLTQKGIPVVDNEGEQQAEVECDEIIFSLEVTKALEERYHKFYKEETSNSEKNELALEAGKLLVEQILFNTDDRTGLIAKCEKGGKINDIS